LWAASRRVNGDADGTRELIDVLLLHRFMHADDIEAGISAALGVGAVSADVVAVEARRHATESLNSNRDLVGGGGSTSGRHTDAQRGAHVEGHVQRVVSLTQRRLMDPAAVIAGLPPDNRPIPSVSSYDELLAKRSSANPASTSVNVSNSASKENIS
jgi:hypothetical protein